MKMRKINAKRLRITLNGKKAGSMFIAIAVFFIVLLMLSRATELSVALTLAIICFGIMLWALEPIPLGLTSFMILFLFFIFKVAEPTIVLSGFSSPAVYLIVAGMMLARAVNETTLTERIAYRIIKKWGETARGISASLLVIIQLQAFFIPATAVRTTLVLPIAETILKLTKAKPGSNLEKLLLFTVAYGGNISGTAILTAAIGNILTVELLKRYTGVTIHYFQWFLYTFPLWLLLIPAIWLLLLHLFPLSRGEGQFSEITREMEERLSRLGPLTKKEKLCIVILLITVVLWMTEPLHHLHPSVPTIMAVILMCLPGIGIAKWEKVVNVNFDNVILIGVTLSMGFVFIDSGAIQYIGEWLNISPVKSVFQHDLLAVACIVFFTQIFHKFISNVSTAVVTLIPIIITISRFAGVEPHLFAFTAGITSLYGFILTVETMPNVIVHGTGKVTQQDFFRPGISATIVTMVITIFVAATWWNIIGII